MNPTILLRPIGVILKEAWNTYRKHANALALVCIIPFIFATVAIIFDPSLANNHQAALGMFTLSAIFSLLRLVFLIFMPLALLATLEEVHHGRHLDVNKAYNKAFSHGIAYLFVILLTMIVVFGGTLLFIIPGIIASIYLTFVLFTFFFEGKRGIDALVTSAWYVRNIWWDIVARKLILGFFVAAAGFIFLLIVGGIALTAGFGISVVSFLFNLFIFLGVVPFAVCFAYALYKDVKLAKEKIPVDPAFIIEAEKAFVILLIVAALITIVLFIVWNLGPGFQVPGYQMSMHTHMWRGGGIRSY